MIPKFAQGCYINTDLKYQKCPSEDTQELRNRVNLILCPVLRGDVAQLQQRSKILGIPS